jgi:hypothetical protein
MAEVSSTWGRSGIWYDWPMKRVVFSGSVRFYPLMDEWAAQLRAMAQGKPVYAMFPDLEMGRDVVYGGHCATPGELAIISAK